MTNFTMFNKQEVVATEYVSFFYDSTNQTCPAATIFSREENYKTCLQQLHRSQHYRLTHLCLVVAAALSPNSLLNPFEDLSLLFGLTLLVLAGCCCGACLACSFGEELDFFTEDGRSASAGQGLGFGLETGGGDLVKKLNRELCFAMRASLKVVFSVLLIKSCQQCAEPPCSS